MPRIPIVVPQGNFGSQNAGAAKSGRSVPSASVKIPAGIAQLRSLFTASGTLSEADARQLNALQNAIAQAIRLIKGVPFLDGNLIQSVTFGANLASTVNHGLGRNWRGYFPLNFQGNVGTFYAIPQGPNGTIGGADARTIFIQNTLATAGTCDLWVY